MLSLAPTPPFQRDFFHNSPLSKYIVCPLLLLPFSLLSTSYDRSLFKVGSIDILCSVFSHQSMIVFPLFYLMEVPYPQTEVPKSAFQWSPASLADCTVLPSRCEDCIWFANHFPNYTVPGTSRVYLKNKSFLLGKMLTFSSNAMVFECN